MKQLCLVFHMLNLFLYTPRDKRCSIVTAHIDVFQQAFCMDKALEGFIFNHTWPDDVSWSKHKKHGLWPYPRKDMSWLMTIKTASCSSFKNKDILCVLWTLRYLIIPLDLFSFGVVFSLKASFEGDRNKDDYERCSMIVLCYPELISAFGIFVCELANMTSKMIFLGKICSMWKFPAKATCHK